MPQEQCVFQGVNTVDIV